VLQAAFLSSHQKAGSGKCEDIKHITSQERYLSFSEVRAKLGNLERFGLCFSM
jgi:hypothetical protein